MRDLRPCCVCGCPDRTLLYPATSAATLVARTLDPYSGHYQINRCVGCGLLYSSPILDEQGVRELYSHYSESNSADEEIGNVRRTMLGYYRLARPHLQRRERFLDVGCDVGLLLDIAAKDGFASVHGLEPVPVACQTAIARMPHADVQAKFYEEADFPRDSFDLITLVHVLDHLAQPEQHLQRALCHLKPGGLVLAVVHNVECMLSRLLGERFPVFNYFHHYFFSKQTLAKLLTAHGFEPLRVSSTRNTYSLAFFLARNPLLPRQIRTAISRASRKLVLGRLPLSLALGNIVIVARKPFS